MFSAEIGIRVQPSFSRATRQRICSIELLVFYDVPHRSLERFAELLAEAAEDGSARLCTSKFDESSMSHPRSDKHRRFTAHVGAGDNSR